VKVFVVTSGSYSDYSIQEIFSTKELADAYLKECDPSDGYDIEEWEMDAAAGHVKRTVYTYSLPGGKAWSYETVDSPTARVPKSERFAANWEPSLSQSVQWSAIGRSLVSHEHAKKLAEEAIQEAIRKKALEPCRAP
jgi:hypothetical protein